MGVAADAFAEIQQEADEIIGDASLSASGRIAKLRRIDERLKSLRGLVQTYMGDQRKVEEAESAGVTRRLLELRANATARERLIAQGRSPEELDAQGFVSHEEIDRLEEEGLLAEAALDADVSALVGRGEPPESA